MDIQSNPFAVKTPETLAAAEIFELFVPYPEFAYLQETGHQFLHGHRGSGKSMMLRMMEPECQSRYTKASLDDLRYFGTYLSIKTTEINQPEFERLEQETSGFVLSEHVLSTKVLSGLIASTGKYVIARGESEVALESVKNFVIKDFIPRLELCGWSDNSFPGIGSIGKIADTFELLSHVIDRLHAQTIRYVKSRAFVTTAHRPISPRLPITMSFSLRTYRSSLFAVALPIVLRASGTIVSPSMLIGLTNGTPSSS